jgi:hypothetical protein
MKPIIFDHIAKRVVIVSAENAESVKLWQSLLAAQVKP